MPTKAGRLRIEDIRVGRVIYDVGIDWSTFSAFARPLKIVAWAPHSYNAGRDIMFTTLEPEGNYHGFHSRRNITQCGFYGTFDQGRPDSEIIERESTPINFFVNKRAAERYMDRMLADGTWPWERPAAFEAYGYKPVKPRPTPENIGPAAQREVEAIWGRINTELAGSPLTGFSNKELVSVIDRYITKLLKTDAKGPVITIESWKQEPDGSVSFTVTGPPEVVASMRAAQQQAASIGVAKDLEGDTIRESFSALDSLRRQLIGTRHEYGIEPSPEGEGSVKAGE
jgi:hypothetical protein